MPHIIEELVYAYKNLYWKYKNFTTKYPRISRYVVFFPVTVLELALSTINTVFSIFISYTSLTIRYYLGINAAKFYAAAAHLAMGIAMIVPTDFAISFMQAFLLSGASLLFGPGGMQAIHFVMRGSAFMVQVLMAVIIRENAFFYDEPLQSVSLAQAIVFNLFVYYNSYDILSQRLNARDFFDEDNSHINSLRNLHSLAITNGPMLFFMANFAPLIGVSIAIAATAGQVALDLYVKMSERIDLSLRRRKARTDNPEMSEEQIETLIHQQFEESRRISAQERIIQARAADRSRTQNAINQLEINHIPAQTERPRLTARERQSVAAYEDVLVAATRVPNQNNSAEVFDAELQAAKQTFALQAANIIKILPDNFLTMIATFNLKQESAERLSQQLDRVDETTQSVQYNTLRRQIYTIKTELYELKQNISNSSEIAKQQLQLQTHHNKYSAHNFWNIDAVTLRKVEDDNPELLSELQCQLMVIPGYVEQRNAADEVVATFKMDLFEFLELLATTGMHPITKKGLTMQDFVFDYKAFKQIQSVKADIAPAEELDAFSANNNQLFGFDRLRNAAHNVYECVVNVPDYAMDYVRQSRLNENPQAREPEIGHRFELPRFVI